MSNLIKIKDLSARYDITARTLRYYEDMGLITGSRTDDYAYRLYDEAAVIRLEQILILRKLNISIKDIQRIFNTTGSGVVLDILNKKVQNIDDEVALLHELKNIVLDFIREIEQMDFTDDTNVKLLYGKAKKIETHVANVDYIGKPSNINRLIDITDKLDKKIPDIMVVRLPKCKAIVSAYQPIWELFSNENNLMGWMENQTQLKKEIIFDCADFLCRHNDGNFRWLYTVHDCATKMDTSPYEVIDFEGGLYAMAVSINDDDESIEKVEAKITTWLDNTNFEWDNQRDVLGNMPYLNENEDDEIKRGLGYHQLQRYIPIKLKAYGG
ncbi:MAG: MerR family transcriptional regulator [Defluviitaleaceae bacterium]|nr:MerR family transcriptional regulator [Defluviitaleaceae bacterium]